jgi:hypothetical protein
MILCSLVFLTTNYDDHGAALLGRKLRTHGSGLSASSMDPSSNFYFLFMYGKILFSR